MTVSTPAEKIAILSELAWEGQTHPDVRDVAFRLTAGKPRAADQARAIHRWVQSTVRYLPEQVETFQRAWYTLRAAAGDCDDHAIAQAALALAAGLPVRVLLWEPLRHAAVGYDFGAGLVWAETTIAAEFGEDPIAALKRLGENTRSDIA